jgi:hypothetical protein
MLRFMEEEMRATVFIVTAVWLRLGGIGWADDVKLLKGMSEIQLQTGVSLGRNAEQCGITDTLLRDAFMYPASDARFKVSDDQRVLTIVYTTRTQTMG